MKRRFSRGYNELQVSAQPQFFTEGKSGESGDELAANTHTHTVNTVCRQANRRTDRLIFMHAQSLKESAAGHRETINKPSDCRYSVSLL